MSYDCKHCGLAFGNNQQDRDWHQWNCGQRKCFSCGVKLTPDEYRTNVCKVCNDRVTNNILGIKA